MVAPLLYYPVFMYTVTTLCVATAMLHMSNTDEGLLYQKGADAAGDTLLPFLACFVYAMFIGLRPFDGIFGDTISYARVYDNFSYQSVIADWDTEWIWQYMMLICKRADVSVSGFVCLVSLCYFFTAFAAICMLMPKNVMITLLFVLSSVMFYSFGINGMRNGLACHITLLGISVMLKGRIMSASIIYACAFGIHRSAFLPIAASVAGAIGSRSLLPVICLWVASIPVSLVSGGYFTGLFASIGFDDRMAVYTQAQDMSLFSHTGFRWDFLLYSAPPVAMAYWVTAVKRITDRWYTVIATVYILCNAFWILVIRSAYSNRFAYLSWFIYPFVIAYPLVNLPLWRYQKQKTCLILVGYAVFTMLLGHMWGLI